VTATPSVREVKEDEFLYGRAPGPLLRTSPMSTPLKPVKTKSRCISVIPREVHCDQRFSLTEGPRLW